MCSGPPNSKKKSARFLYSSRQTIVSFMSTEGESDEVTHAAKQFFKQCVTQSKQMWPLLEPTTRNTHVSRHNLGLGHLLSWSCTLVQYPEQPTLMTLHSALQWLTNIKLILTSWILKTSLDLMKTKRKKELKKKLSDWIFQKIAFSNLPLHSIKFIMDFNWFKCTSVARRRPFFYGECYLCKNNL